MKISLPDAEATRSLGGSIGAIASPGSVILLEGDLGAGKTTLVQGIGVGLGIQDSIDSPTFTLINEYLDGRIPLYHLDLYRLEPVEVEALNLETYWEGIEMPPGIVAIEWAERLPYKPDSYLQVCLSYQEGRGRHVEVISTDELLHWKVEYLRNIQNKTWEEIIESATRTNAQYNRRFGVE